MLVMIQTVGWRLWKLRSYSQASTTKDSPWPERLEPPSWGTLPPMTKDGSAPQGRRAWEVREVVVVLAWVPEVAMANRSCMTWPRSWAYFRWGRPSFLAARNSGLESGTAAVRTTRSTSRLSSSPSCVREIFAPRLASSMAASLKLGSEPVTVAPASRRTRARPAIPHPPMPMKWTRLPAKRLADRGMERDSVRNSDDGGVGTVSRMVQGELRESNRDPPTRH